MTASNAPGAAFDYSNTPYLLLGLLIEAVTGNSWAEEIEERVFAPAGMRNSTARRFDPDPLRLSSYQERDGELVDVTDARWVTRGEAGVASTTADMIAFLKALLVDGTLPVAGDARRDDRLQRRRRRLRLRPRALPRVDRGRPDGDRLRGRHARHLERHLVRPDSGTFVSMASSLDTASTNAPSRGFGANLDGLAAWSTVQDGDPLTIRSISAAGIAIAATADGLRLAAGDASLTLDRSLRATTTSNTVFDDGSVLVVGDDAAGIAGDDAANDIRIARDFAAALDRDNQLIGLGGDDRLSGGRGGDRIAGGSGADRLRGLAGDDDLVGGSRARPAVRRRRATTGCAAAPGPTSSSAARGATRCPAAPAATCSGSATATRCRRRRRDRGLRPGPRHHRPAPDRCGRRRPQLRLRLDRPRGLLGDAGRAGARSRRRPRLKGDADGDGRPTSRSCSPTSTGSRRTTSCSEPLGGSGVTPVLPRSPVRPSTRREDSMPGQEPMTGSRPFRRLNPEAGSSP